MLDSSTDPKGYYAALGATPGASTEALHAAFRARAKQLHPDRNAKPDADEAFQRLNEAWACLRDPRRRAEYDSGGAVATVSETQPHVCRRCQKVTAQPRHVVFHRVRGRLLTARREREEGIFCRDCADRTAIMASAVTWATGFPSVVGLFLAPGALLRNMMGGTMPRDENARLLLHQARAFLARGDVEMARTQCEQARPFAANPELRRQADHMLDALGPGTRRLKDRWGLWGHAFVVQALPLAGLALALVVLAVVAWLRWEPGELAARIRVQRPVEGETRHVATEMLKVRQGPDPTTPVIALLDRFTTVQVAGALPGGEWVRVETPGGVSGFVQSRWLFGGSGAAAQIRWCIDHRGDPPANGEVLNRRSGGAHELTVRNTMATDAVVRLKSPTGRTMLTFFVAAGSTARIDGIPDGTFRAVFAIGADFSRACGVYMREMRTYVVPKAQTFRAWVGEPAPALVIPPPGDGPERSQPVEPVLFVDTG
ncbi:MAG: DnaJ domain-containing protein [Alphaproteobacteria bacterium]|nr:DnaJ domain-containing protein [Alphaproteobacteria bacterium]